MAENTTPPEIEIIPLEAGTDLTDDQIRNLLREDSYNDIELTLKGSVFVKLL